MRRAANIVFFLAVIACAVLFYWRRSRRAETLRPDTAVTNPPSTAPGAPPRPAPAPAPPSRDAGAASTAHPDDETILMQQLRALAKKDPERAEALARAGRLRYPDSPWADERDALLVDTLINQQRIGAARSETYYYFDHHPGGRFTDHLFAMTGVHPAPSGPGR
jgi:hypothetical protein